MCDNVFKNEEEQKRREEFTKLFALLASNIAKPQPLLQSAPKKTLNK